MATSLFGLFQGGAQRAVRDASKPALRRRLADAAGTIAAGSARGGVNPLAAARQANEAAIGERARHAEQMQRAMAQARMDDAAGASQIFGNVLGSAATLGAMAIPGAQVAAPKVGAGVKGGVNALTRALQPQEGPQGAAQSLGDPRGALAGAQPVQTAQQPLTAAESRLSVPPNPYGSGLEGVDHVGPEIRVTPGGPPTEAERYLSNAGATVANMSAPFSADPIAAANHDARLAQPRTSEPGVLPALHRAPGPVFGSTEGGPSFGLPALTAPGDLGMVGTPPDVSAAPGIAMHALSPLAGMQTVGAPPEALSGIRGPGVEPPHPHAALGLTSPVPPLTVSDERAKRELADARRAIDEFLGAARASGFAYNGAPGDRRTGIMAQDVEGTEVGGQIVRQAPDGTRVIDNERALHAALAGLARMNERLSAVEGGAPAAAPDPREQASTGPDDEAHQRALLQRAARARAAGDEGQARALGELAAAPLERRPASRNVDMGSLGTGRVIREGGATQQVVPPPGVRLHPTDTPGVFIPEGGRERTLGDRVGDTVRRAGRSLQAGASALGNYLGF